ncbi:MAG: OmpA family protein [Bacteroidales bacterium]|nr:OmpA family protein [Bacteroidales bacterium]MBD5288036.1 OmpA family protein [Bacteroides sp.]MBD5386532.1 OmpA family protein [bacterium]
MKAKNLYYAMAVAGALGVAAPANAQDVFVAESTTVTEFNCDNTNHYFANWRNNWFIELGAGATVPFVEHGSNKKFDKNRITVQYGFGFGRWVSPYVGFRIKAMGGPLHWNQNTHVGVDNGWTRSKHAQLQAELMWDMFNSIKGPNSNRVFSLIPFVGLGGDANWDIRDAAGNQPAAATNVFDDNRKVKNVVWTLPVSAGLQFRFRLCKYVDFFAEARASFYGDNWNGSAMGSSIESNVSVMGGFNFNIGGRGWNTYNECDYVSQIAALNGQVNNLRADLIAAGETIANLESQLPCPPATVQKDCVNAPLMSTVRFTINSAKIMPTEEVNIYNMAEWLKANPNEKVMVVGYADKDTGTAEYNLQLSEKRANAVADALVENYGIDRNRLTVKYDGSDVQPYSTNDWNRIVIFTQK